MSNTAWQLEMARPHFLIGLLALVPVVYWSFRGLVDFRRAQRIASLLLRCAIIVLLALALAGLTLWRPATRPFVVVAIDQSLSISSQSARKAREYAEEVWRAASRQRNLVRLRFAKVPGEIEPLTSRGIRSSVGGNESADPGDIDNPSPDRGESPPDRMGTDLAAAIELATAAIPPSYAPHVVLLSDGNQTQGDAVQAALAAGVPVSTVPLAPRDKPEVQVSAVNVPAQVRQGEPFQVEVVIDSNHDDQGAIQVYRGDVLVSSETGQAARVHTGQNRFRFPQQVSDQRLIQYTATISGFRDQLLDNNSASGLVSAEGRPRALLVDRDPKSTLALRWALQEQGIAVTVRPPAGVPASLAELEAFDVMLLSDVPATALRSQQMDIIRTYVQDLGGGMIMLGGDQSFGLGGYNKTTLEEILPVWSDFEKEKEKPSLAMVLVIDKSGSMGGEKIELAKDAAKGTVQLLSPRDQIGILAFDGDSYWVSQLHSAADASYVSRRIGTIQAGGGTNMYPPMVKAYQALSATVAKVKHVILLTDGISAPGDFDAITGQLVRDRITVSTVAVGDEADRQLLQRIAQQGNGRYYACDDPQSVPQIFARETITVSKPAINELPFAAQMVRPTPVLSQVHMETAPFLLGFVVTRPKPTCELILATESGEPLLAWWRYGLGVTVAFTSDAKSRWAAEWLSWPDFGIFWAQVVRHAMRKSEARGVYVQLKQHGDTAEVQLDAIDDLGGFRNYAETRLSVIGPRQDRPGPPIRMPQVAPGRYRAQLNTPRQGFYHLQLTQRLGQQLVFRQTRGLVVGYPEELRLRPTNEGLLRRIAQVSGGQYDPDPASLWRRGGRTARRPQPLWPLLLAVAAVLFCADVALRRIDFALLPRWRDLRT